ncbi:unnamed protein product [Lymnaea stagnalis]|uniref:AIG1-type G domain-containing protein n=1 Tax=Lymnaea stagnalis TaxID=6523 RepID=A0AAV2HHE2_LYMST
MKHLEIEAEQLEMRQSLEKKHQVILEALQNDAINKEHEEDKKAHEKLEELEREHGKRGKTQGLESFKSNDVSEFSNKFQKISFLTIPMHEVIKIKENINVLLIGNTGSGKSATGNSVLRRQVFKSVLSSMPVTTNISSETYTFDDRVITVFDGPGFEDPSEEAPVSEEYFIKAMKQANAVNASGYHAFIIVFSAMRKADASDMNLIRLVKKYFGEDFLRKFCVIVMTGGDLLNDTLFSHWCSENTGSNEIILECGKAVLFDNKTKDQSRLELQFKCLISLIDNLNQSDEELITFPDSITQAL